MDDAKPVQLCGFEMKACKNTVIENRRNRPSTSSEPPANVSAAGGVAIYRNVDSVSECKPIRTIDVSRKLKIEESSVGDICPLDVAINDHTKFLLGVVYLHPNAYPSQRSA
ncbi:hypothetical protein L798_09941 [Zootermopsis nevadensis]|uniref:Uncharacterized protein n=1 Tax=Zootermopsis nevadensis TaxID=136037 RepID=A0A067QXY7_ZOONE|nr:hypothetical protein L798_09941 [Zootermopsis nevadensis]